MKLLLTLIACLLGALQVSRADDSTLSSAIASIPPCALTCLISNLQNSSCSTTDIVCQCADTELGSHVESCVIKSCTLSQAIMTKNVTQSLCGIQPRDHSHVIGILGITGGTLAAIAVTLRAVARFKSLGGGFWWDDWTIIFTAILAVPFSALSYIASIGRLGKDIWSIPLKDIIIFFHQFYFAEVLYAALLPLTKVSILFFYLRIFPGLIIRRITWFLIVFTTLTAITFVCVNAFQCTPVNHYWRQWDDEPGRCFAPSGPAWTISAIGIVVDVLMLGLPLHEIRKLTLPLRKKLSVGLMFGVGCFVMIVSILRLQSLVHFRKTTNPTYDYYSIGYWSIVEVDIGIICACMPSMRVLLSFVFPRFIGSSHEHGTSPPTVPRLANEGQGRNLANGIHYKNTYFVEYNSKLNRDGSKFVQLMDIEGAASSRSEISVDEETRREQF